MAEGKTLGERISWITGQVAPIEATGQNRFSKAAMSVEDVEDALRPLFAEAGVVALWSCTGHETSQDKEAAWLLNFRVAIYADDHPEDRIEADWFDVGSSPSAAESFAVKGFYRRLFHLASAEDEQRKAGAPPRRRQERGAEPKENGETVSGPSRSAQDGSSAPVPEPEELATVTGLASTLTKPWADAYLRQEVTTHGLDAVLRRLKLAHAEPRNCGRVDCQHVLFAVTA
jgi:hypothetical protein